jgi:2-C-methyl-D-erythritol 2,4-cyclodiphosphate synthase
MSRVFVEETLRIVRARGYEIENVDVTVVAQEPTLAPHLPAMRESLAALLGLSADAISVKAKSTDRLGAIGRGEGIAAEAVVLLRDRP